MVETMYESRINESYLIESFDKKVISVLLGPRRVGKTTLVEHYIAAHPQRVWVQLNMDSQSERLRVSKGELALMLVEQARQAIGGEEKIWVAIEEAQKCPDLFGQIKLLYDDFLKKKEDKIKFILTGSGHLDLHQLTAESLAGRVELLHLADFSLRESAILKENKIPTLSLLDELDTFTTPNQLEDRITSLLPYRPILEDQLTSQLIWSGLPEVLACENDKDKTMYLNNYIDTYFEKDVRALETISDLPLYRRMMEVLAEQTGSIRDETRHLEALGCARDTLKKYRGYLQSTLFYEEIYPYLKKTLKRMVKSPKGYLTNNGIISSLTGISNLAVLEKSGLIGHRFENWFLKELRVWLARHYQRSEISYWHLSTGVKVDFIVEKKPKVFPFEVTYGTTPKRDKISHLIKFMEDEPAATWGFYIYRGEFQVHEKYNILFIPAWAVG